MVRDGRIQPLASWSLAREIAEVLRRPRLARYAEITEEQVEAVMILLAPLLPDVDVHSPVRDPDDAPVIASALEGGAAAIITGDRDLSADVDLVAWLRARDIEVLTPARTLERMQ
jgi:putative PIN family toxin of toxin-antitoxin system